MFSSSTSSVDNASSPTVPTPPPMPTDASDDVEGYWHLLQSLSSNLRVKILEELQSPIIIRRADKLQAALAANDFSLILDLSKSRRTFLAALLCLQRGTISVNQLATLHLMDSAVRTLYTAPLSYLIYKYKKDDKVMREVRTSQSLPDDSKLDQVKILPFDTIPLPDSASRIEDLPLRMQTPLISRFFNFSNVEWQLFREEMVGLPESETRFAVLMAPEFGCWSSLVSTIQKYLKCMQMLDWQQYAQGCLITETIMVVPTFSMFQAAINAKARALGRQPVQLVPTYGYLPEQQYARLKTVGQIALAMYLPEKSPRLRYHRYKGSFRRHVDGHPKETAFAGAIHDVYHAFRELLMNDNVANARFRLAGIAQHHAKNKKSRRHRPMDEILVDGELVMNVHPDVDTIYKPEHRSAKSEIFGDIFYLSWVKDNLHKKLKREFIKDMVVHKDEWAENFNIGRDDLRFAEQMIYDDIEAELNPSPAASPR